MHCIHCDHIAITMRAEEEEKKKQKKRVCVCIILRTLLLCAHLSLANMQHVIQCLLFVFFFCFLHRFIAGANTNVVVFFFCSCRCFRLISLSVNCERARCGRVTLSVSIWCAVGMREMCNRGEKTELDCSGEGVQSGSVKEVDFSEIVVFMNEYGLACCNVAMVMAGGGGGTAASLANGLLG